MGDRLQRCQDDDGAARSTHTSLSYPGDRKRQLPLQEQLRPNPNEQEGESRPLDQNLRPKPYMKAGHFSAKIPGQLSAEINTVAKLGGWKSAQHVFQTYGHAMDDDTLADLITDTPATRRNKARRKAS